VPRIGRNAFPSEQSWCAPARLERLLEFAKTAEGFMVIPFTSSWDGHRAV